jgi:cell division septation protein DedD
MEQAGVARVRVTRVFPDGREQVRVARNAAARAADLFIQVAAVSDLGRARELAAALGRFGPSGVTTAPSGLRRVRLGPFTSTDEAERMLAKVHLAGYREARIVRGAQS